MADEREANQDAKEELLRTKVSEKKRRGTFQPLRKLFGKKKKQGSPLHLQEGKLKASDSIRSVCSNPSSALSSDEEAYDDLRFLVSSMGTRAFSHDSIFIPDGQAEEEHETPASAQDCGVGKVKSLQQQLGKNIKFGQPPPTTPIKRMQDLGPGKEEKEGLSHSPMEVSEQHEAGLDAGSRATRSPSPHNPRKVPETEPKSDEKATMVKTSRQKRPSGTIDSINLDAVPCSVARLDNSAARHKLSVKPKNQRVSKKHRGMSQDLHTVEDNANEATLNVHKSLNKAMYHSVDIYSHDIMMSDNFDRKAREVQVSEPFRSLASKGESPIKKDLEGKLQELKHVKESRSLNEGKSEEVKRKEEEERHRQEIIRSMELERLQKIKEQKENEIKEQQKREEEKKLRAEQILKELEEQRKQEKLKQHVEEKKAHELAEEQKKHELEIQRAHQIAEEKRRQEMEQQRAIQLEEEQKKKELEQTVLKMAEEQKKGNLGEQTEQQKYELEKQKVFQFAGEKKSNELEQQKVLDMPEKKKQRETTTEKNVKISEQKQQEPEKKTEEQLKQKLEEPIVVQMVEQKESKLKQPKTIEIQKQHDSEDIGDQHQISKLQSDDLNIQDKQTLQGQEISISEVSSTDKTLHGKQSIGEEVRGGDEAELKQKLQKELESQQQERINEELRWQELDQKQRPFTFKVTSGEKQIIFEKVHLSPVTVSKEPILATFTQDPKENKAIISSHNLPSAKCIPHTAILVTGAQLCGTAVNLDQIQDTACKSLLGLGEERKIDPTDNIAEKDSAKQSSSKTKYTSEALDNQAFLAEWASIRSKILCKSESEKNESDPRVSSDDLPSKIKSDSHSSLRKTLSASAKFSITPAWQKFSESGKTPEMNTETPITHSSKENIAVLPDDKTQGKTMEKALMAQEMSARLKKQGTTDGNAEGWIFSKDLPSFLVPNPPQSPRRANLEGQMSPETHLSNGTLKTDKLLLTEDKVTPFGIKLRRTNYSLRFHADPQNEQKRKKRYSAGDSFEGVPAPLTPTDETETRTIARKELLGSPVKIRKENLTKVVADSSNSASDLAPCIISPLAAGSSPHVSLPIKDRAVPKSPTMQRPTVAPKPASPTPPSSPLSHLGKTNVLDQHEQWMEKSEDEISRELNTELLSLNRDDGLQHDAKDKAGLASIPWREKRDKRPESAANDRPVLKSRHSLDGSRLMEKVETAQPLWITLALQKQKGFRDQQATREERRLAREAKQADKLSKENPSSIQLGEYRSRSGSLQKLVPQDEKKSDTVVTRLQRREQLQKSNTLPTSVTVEITETVPVALAKDLPKRFSSPDASPVSSEPAWLALAKRKSKAWSDCPQIIK